MKRSMTRMALAGIAVLGWVALPGPVQSADGEAAAPPASDAPAAVRCDDPAVEACTDAFSSCTALLPWRVDAKGPEMEQCAAAYKECLERSGC